MSTITIPKACAQRPLVSLTNDLAFDIGNLLERNMPDTAYFLIVRKFDSGETVSPELCDDTLRELAKRSNNNNFILAANDFVFKCCEKRIKLDDSLVEKVVISLRDKDPQQSLRLLSMLLDNDYSIKKETIEYSIVRLREHFPLETVDVILSAQSSAKRGITADINYETIEITFKALLNKNPKKAFDLLKGLIDTGEEFKEFSEGFIQRAVIGLDQADARKESCELIEQVLDKSFKLRTIEVAVQEIRNTNPELAARILMKAFDKDYIPYKAVVENTIIVLRATNSALALSLTRKAVESDKEVYDFNPETINITIERTLINGKINDTVANIIFFLDKGVHINQELITEALKILSENNSHDLALKLMSKCRELRFV